MCQRQNWIPKMFVQYQNQIQTCFEKTSEKTLDIKARLQWCCGLHPSNHFSLFEGGDGRMDIWYDLLFRSQNKDTSFEIDRGLSAVVLEDLIGGSWWAPLWHSFLGPIETKVLNVQYGYPGILHTRGSWAHKNSTTSSSSVFGGASEGSMGTNTSWMSSSKRPCNNQYPHSLLGSMVRFSVLKAPFSQYPPWA